MKTIGFVDYYISEWHANNYPVWIKEICEKTGDDFAVKCAWAEEYVSPVDGRNTDEWCKEFGVEKCETIEELCEKCDYILVLAPTDPEKHLKYAEEVLKFKKNTYIDKTFAPDYREAKEIFDIANKYGTKFFSSSALRYADEISNIENASDIVTHGGGSNLPEYIIHQIEMCVKLLKSEPQKVMVEKQGKNHYICKVSFKDNKSATMIYSSGYNFEIYVTTSDGKEIYRKVTSDMFKNLIGDILRFYNTGETSFDANETLDVMKIRTGVIEGIKNTAQWIDL